MATRPRTSNKIDWTEFVFSIGLTFVGGWVFMLTVGIIHHEWLHQVPTLGYWPSFLIFFMVDWCVSLMRWHARSVPVHTNGKSVF